jgi:anti-sigma-K factor RskA
MSDIHALSGAYAVDAVDDIERASFERHLASCPTCRAEVASLREASALLADAATTTPPPELRDAVLSGITRVRPLPPVTVGGPVHRRRWFPALVAAVVLALVGVGGAVWQPWRDDASQTLSATDQVLQDPEAQQVSQTLPNGATATVVRSPKEHRAVLVTEDLPEPPAGKVYQLWLQTPSEDMVPAGLMPAGGSTALLDGNADDAIGVGLSLEPAGGSEQPTEVVALIDLGSA